MASIRNYFSLVKFSHTIFALPFALIGFFLGGKTLQNEELSTSKPLWQLLLCVVLCMVFARSAAMAFNRWLDKHYDALNPRTSVREIPAGIIPARHALLFVIVNAVAFIITTRFINPLCFYLSPIALFVVLFYSYTKRFTALCHFVLGIGLSLAPIGAYLAVTGQFALLPVLFSLSVIFWVSGFDIIYALQDIDFDRSHQLRSLPAWLGKRKALHTSSFLHLLSIGFIVYAGTYTGFWSLWYWAGAAVFAAMLIYQHSIVKPNDLSRVNLAFMTTNGIASVVFSLFVITDLI